MFARILIGDVRAQGLRQMEAIERWVLAREWSESWGVIHITDRAFGFRDIFKAPTMSPARAAHPTLST